MARHVSFGGMTSPLPALWNPQDIRPRDLSFEFLEGGVDEVARGGLFRDWRALPCLLTLVVSRGTFSLRTKSDQYSVGPEGLLVLPGGTPHQIHCTAGLRITWAHLQFRLFDSVDLFSVYPPLRPVLSIENTQGARQALLKLAREGTGPGLTLGRAAQVNAMGFQWLQGVGDFLTFDEEVGAREQAARAMLPAIGFLEEHALRPPPVAEQAARTGLSAGAFTRRFRQTTGLAPAQYAAAKRFEKSQRLLLGNRRPIAEVAREVGYENPFHFTRFFAKHAGMSPRVWRQRATFQNLPPDKEAAR